MLEIVLPAPQKNLPHCLFPVPITSLGGWLLLINFFICTGISPFIYVGVINI